MGHKVGQEQLGNFSMKTITSHPQWKKPKWIQNSQLKSSIIIGHLSLSRFSLWCQLPEAPPCSTKHNGATVSWWAHIPLATQWCMLMLSVFTASFLRFVLSVYLRIWWSSLSYLEHECQQWWSASDLTKSLDWLCPSVKIKSLHWMTSCYCAVLSDNCFLLRGHCQIQQAAERPERNFVDTRQLKVIAHQLFLL